MNIKKAKKTKIQVRHLLKNILIELKYIGFCKKNVNNLSKCLWIKIKYHSTLYSARIILIPNNTNYKLCVFNRIIYHIICLL